MNNWKNQKRDTSWQKVSKWYDNSVGEKGHYYHEHVVIPNTLKLLNLSSKDKILDLGCGQGVLARNIPKDVKYLGVDLASDLINSAKKQNKNPNHKFIVSDITKDLNISERDFSICTIILSIQNVENFEAVIQNTSKYLKLNGQFVIIMNHPIFRIPRQTSWGIDENNKLQFRKIFRYLSPLKIPINMTPGGGKSTLTWSFHNPLENYVKALKKYGFVITDLEEWVSDKKSVGKAARMENRSREEIPMFMAILGRKQL